MSVFAPPASSGLSSIAPASSSPSARSPRRRLAAAVAALLAATSPATPPAMAQHVASRPEHGLHVGGPHGPGGPGGPGGAGRVRAAVYQIVTVGAVTDGAAAKAAAARLGPALAGTSGRLLVDADDPASTSGTGPSHVAVIVFDDVWSAQAWQKSDPVRSILADLGRAGTVQVVSAGGIADPGARPSVPIEALGPGKALRTIVIPKIADICKGC